MNSEPLWTELEAKNVRKLKRIVEMLQKNLVNSIRT